MGRGGRRMHLFLRRNARTINIYGTAQKFEAVPGKIGCKARVASLTLTETQSEMHSRVK